MKSNSMKSNTPARTSAPNSKTIFSPSKTLFSFGFKQSQSPGSSKASDDPKLPKSKLDVIDLSSDNVLKGQGLNLNSTLGEHNSSNDKSASGQKRDWDTQQQGFLSTNNYDSQRPPEEKKPKLSETRSTVDQVQEHHPQPNANTPDTRTFTGLRLCLVRIDQVDCPLHSLCTLIYKTLVSGNIDSDFYLLNEGTTLGRQPATASNDASALNPDIGIPSDERVISREHLHIVHMEKTNTVSFPVPQYEFSADRKQQLYSFLQGAQRLLPKMKIRVNAKNSIRIHKRRVTSNNNTMIQNQDKETLQRGQESTLSVGDVIFFEASTKTRKKDYIYRLLAVECSSTVENSICPTPTSPTLPQKRPELTTTDASPAVHQGESTMAEVSSSSSLKDSSSKGKNALKSPSPLDDPKYDSNHSTKRLEKKDSAKSEKVEKVKGSVHKSSNLLDHSKSVDVIDTNNSTFRTLPKSCLSDKQTSIHSSNKPIPVSQTELPSGADHTSAHNETIVDKSVISSDSNEKSKPDTDSTMKVISRPVIGDRFRILFSVDDCFGRKQDIWYFGTATAVKKKRYDMYTLDVQLDDTTAVTVEYPDKDVERLLSGNGGEGKMPTLSSIVYALDPENKPYVIAYDMQPKELFIGDLVLCHFQNGHSNDGWLHGRVAAFNVGRKAFDVLYFGGDYEEGVPLASGNVYLIERGNEKMNWITGLTLPTPLFRHSSETLSTIIMHGSRLTLKHPNGEGDSPEYDDLVRILFLHHRAVISKNKDRCFRWPLIANPHQAKKPYRIYSKSTACFEQHKWSVDKLDADTENEESNEVVTPVMPPEIRPIHFANQLWRSINSSQPHNGYGILSHLMEVFHRFPTDLLHANLQKFMIEGPKNDGVKIRDPNKTELVHRYTRAIAEHCSHNDIVCQIHPRSWEDFQMILNLPSADGLSNVDVTTEAVARRVLQGLQFACQSLDFISELILDEVKGSTEQTVLSRSRELYRSKTLIGYALNHGIRESIKISLRSFMKCWIEYETFRLNYSRVTCGSSNEVHRCLDEYERCMKSLGVISSSLAWCYCAENGLGFGHKDFCALFRDIVESEIRNSDLTFTENGALVGLSKKDDLIFRIILSLRTQFSLPLEANLAELFGLSGAFSIVFESLTL